MFEVLSKHHQFHARCLAPHGVALRRSRNLEDRAVGIRGPSCGDVINPDELKGTWMRYSGSWLPLVIGGERVFEVVEIPAAVEDAPCQRDERRQALFKPSLFW